MDLSVLLSITDSRKVILQTLRPSDILNLFSVLKKILTVTKKFKYLTFEREVMKNVDFIDTLVTKGGTVLFVGDDVKNILSRFNSRYENDKLDKSYYNIWIVCIREFSMYKGEIDPGYSTGIPVLHTIPTKWHRYNCTVSQHMYGCEAINPEAFYRQPEVYSRNAYYNWWSTSLLTENDIKLFSNTGQINHSTQTYSPIVNMKYGTNIPKEIRILTTRNIPHINVGENPSMLRYGRKYKNLIGGHVPITVNVVGENLIQELPIIEFI